MARPGWTIACATSLTLSVGCSAAPALGPPVAASVEASRRSAQETAAAVCRLTVNGDRDTGVGFVLRTDVRGRDVFVVTAFHVVADAEQVSAAFDGGRGEPWHVALEIVKEDPVSDIALLHGFAQGHAPAGLPLARAEPRPGQPFEVYAYPPDGAPLFALRAERGFITGVQTGSAGADLLRTSAYVDLRSSGGPAVDDSGGVIGVTSPAAGTQAGLAVIVPSSHIKALYARYGSPESPDVVVRRRIARFLAADPRALSSALSSRLVSELLPMLNQSLEGARAKATVIRVVLANHGLSLDSLPRDRQDEIVRRVMTNDENAAVVAERAFERSRSLHAAAAVYFRALAETWIGTGDDVTLVGVQLTPEERVLGTLVVGRPRDGVALRIVLRFVFERGTWKVDDVQIGSVAAGETPRPRGEGLLPGENSL